MNNSVTLDKMRELRLSGMYVSFRTFVDTGQTDEKTPDQLVGELVDAEYEDRVNRKIHRLIEGAKFKYKAAIESINFHQDRNIDRTLMLRLAECDYISKFENVLITGPTGIGKSYLASALGYQACAKEYKTLYWSTPKLFTKLKQAKADNSYIKEIDKIARMDLLILDDFGLYPLDAQSRLMLMEIIEDRHGKGSTIFTSQLPVKDWYNMIGEKTISDAVMDRILQYAHRIDAIGESMRRTRQKKTGDNIYE